MSISVHTSSETAKAAAAPTPISSQKASGCINEDALIELFICHRQPTPSELKHLMGCVDCREAAQIPDLES